MEPDFESVVRAIRARDKRFSPAAFKLVRDGLSYTARKLGKHTAEGADRHMSGPELAAGIRDFALERYGCSAAHLLVTSGIRKSEDIGTIVFLLIDAGIFGKSDDDRPEDFAGVFDFRDAFVAPYRPGIRLRRRRPSVCADPA